MRGGVKLFVFAWRAEIHVKTDRGCVHFSTQNEKLKIMGLKNIIKLNEFRYNVIIMLHIVLFVGRHSIKNRSLENIFFLTILVLY